MTSTKDHGNGTLYTTSSLKTCDYDVICIGSGWASRPIASRAVAAGLEALIIDNDLIGGDCPFWACVPSKALLRPSEALEAAKAVGGARERVTDPNVDAKAVFNRRDAFTRGWNDEKLLVPTTLETGTDLLRGTAKLVGVKKIAVTSKDGHSIEITARCAVAICTGSTPRIPDVPGLKAAHPWTPKEATSASSIPKHLIILGTGAVGCEMATVYSSFGAKVTVISSTSEILSKLDNEAGRLVRTALEARGVEFLLGSTLVEVQRMRDSSITVKTSSGTQLSASEILVATGRKPRTDGCGLELFDIPIDGTPVEVDESLRVKSVRDKWLYAVGDVNGRSPLTHMCKYQARIAATAIIRQARGDLTTEQAPWNSVSATADHLAIPQVIFTQPAVASVGLSRMQAKERNVPVRIIQTGAVTVGALLHGDTFGEGWAQWVVDAESEKLLGMTVVGQDATELIHAATVAIVGGVRLDRLVHTVPCFPTMSEVYLNLIEAAGL
ncbi:putative oxidoreductase [Viridothelium virens]|uniref:Putative oxidoreductase n=1 Tax=Viridothelium virens TaxID=1048519 RepID=A0A6A6HNI9_VIRVR|nr:putative oxidoreductase [Viridothelium virens]